MATDTPAGFPERVDKYVSEYTESRPNVVLVIGRSKNENIVVYEARMEGSSLAASDTVDAYWLDIDPEYQERARKKGKTDDRVELGTMERAMAYGVKSKARGDGSFAITMVALPGKEIILRLDGSGRPRFFMVIAGKEAIVSRVMVHTKEGWIKPTVLHVDFFGTDPETGATVHERQTP